MESEKLEKKKYVAPTMEEIDVECSQFLCGSCDDPDCIVTEVE
jgi:hypothetical protein